MANGRLDYHRICQNIYNQSRAEPVMVFSIQGIVSYYFESSKIAKRTLRETPQNLVGVYDKRATLKMISEDIL